jgi:type II secretory pathway pseudopilin PulG
MSISFFQKQHLKGESLMNKQTQSGFAIIEAVLIVVVLALLGGVGFWVVSKNKTTQQSANQSTVETKKPLETAKTPTAAVEQTLTQSIDTETAADDDGAASVENEIDGAINAAATVGDSFNENNL